MQPSSDLSDVMTETAHTRAEHKPRPLIDLAVSILIPSLILMKL
ncbi:MAG TPA: MFS transporter, partial [Pseudomonas sp.]|nr:MFS transporter [Pseudomonas sp.]